MSLVIDTLIKEAFFHLVDSIAAGKHQAIAAHISEFLRTNDLERIATDLVGAASPCLRSLIEGLDNRFSNVESVYCALCACVEKLLMPYTKHV